MPTATYRQIGKVILGADGTISFNSIPNTYTDLRIVIRHGITNSGFALGMRFNSAASIYYFTANRGISGNISTYNKTGMVYGGIHSQTGHGSVNNLAIIDIYGYAKTDRYKTYSVQMASNATLSATDVGLMTGCWADTSAISSIQIAECGDGSTGAFNTGNILAGSSAILYGIKGA